MNKAVDYLESVGYNVQHDTIQCKLEGCEWVAYKRTDIKTKDCTCNDKPPQIAIVYHTLLRESYKVELIQENDLSWVDLSFYGLSEEDILKNLLEIEKRLVKAWEATWGEL